MMISIKIINNLNVKIKIGGVTSKKAVLKACQCVCQHQIVSRQHHTMSFQHTSKPSAPAPTAATAAVEASLIAEVLRIQDRMIRGIVPQQDAWGASMAVRLHQHSVVTTSGDAPSRSLQALQFGQCNIHMTEAGGRDKILIQHDRRCCITDSRASSFATSPATTSGPAAPTTSGPTPPLSATRFATFNTRCVALARRRQARKHLLPGRTPRRFERRSWAS
jgi:hypothetical protein